MKKKGSMMTANGQVSKIDVVQYGKYVVKVKESGC